MAGQLDRIADGGQVDRIADGGQVGPRVRSDDAFGAAVRCGVLGFIEV